MWKLARLAAFFGCTLGSLIDGVATARVTAEVMVIASVSCSECGVVSAGLEAATASDVRLEHIRSHLGVPT